MVRDYCTPIYMLCYVMFMFVVFKFKTPNAHISAISEICALNSTNERLQNCALDRTATVMSLYIYIYV